MSLNAYELGFQAVADKITAAMVSGQRLDYVKKLILGNHREILTSDTIPAVIILHPRAVPEEWHAMPRQKKATLIIEARGLLKVSPDAAVVSSGSKVGILKMAGDMLDVLEDDLRLNDSTLRPDFSVEKYDSVGEETMRVTIGLRLFLNLFQSAERGT